MENRGPQNLEEFYALPEGDRVNAVAFFVEENTVLASIDDHGVGWTLGQYADGRWFRSVAR